MNEKNKLIIVLSVLALLIIGTIVFSIVESKQEKKAYNEFEEKFNGDTNTLVYIGRPTCGYCNLLQPSMDDMSSRYGFDYFYINTDKESKRVIGKIADKLGITSIGTPYLAVVSKGRIVDVQNGYADYDEVFKFLQKNEIISKDAELLLNYIGIDEYKKLVDSKKASVIVVGQSTCSFCVKAKVILNEIASKNDISINYLNLSYLTKDEALEFTSSFDYFESNSWGTPLTLIVKNGKIVDMLERLATEETYIKFFEKNGVL